MARTIHQILQELHSMSDKSELLSKYTIIKQELFDLINSENDYSFNKNYYINHVGREFIKKAKILDAEELIKDEFDGGFRPLGFKFVLYDVSPLPTPSFTKTPIPTLTQTPSVTTTPTPTPSFVKTSIETSVDYQDPPFTHEADSLDNHYYTYSLNDTENRIENFSTSDENDVFKLRVKLPARPNTSQAFDAFLSFYIGNNGALCNNDGNLIQKGSEHIISFGDVKYYIYYSGSPFYLDVSSGNNIIISLTPLSFIAPTPSITNTVTSTTSVTPSNTVTPTLSATPAGSPSFTPTVTPTSSSQVAASPSVTPSLTPTVTPTSSSQVAASPSVTPSLTPTVTPSNTVTPSLTLSSKPAPISQPDGDIVYQINNDSGETEFDSLEYTNIIQDAVNHWDRVIVGQPLSDWKLEANITFDSLGEGTLGSASISTAMTTEGNLKFGEFFPNSGNMTLNTFYLSDMKNNVGNAGKSELYYVVKHEIGHLLGLGSFILQANSTIDGEPVVTYSEDGVDKYYYTGQHAFQAYKDYFEPLGYNVSEFSGIPIEDDGGAGTANSHPEEGELGTNGSISANDRIIGGVFHPGLEHELMAGWSENGNYNPMSKISIGFLHDMGFNVDYNEADPYNPEDPLFGVS